MSATKEQKAMARIFRRAANEYLAIDDRFHFGRSSFSCDAISFASTVDSPRLKEIIKELGCDTHGFSEFEEFEEGEVRQGARFLWLHFVAEGLERGEIEL